ncbi:MAG: hypothetical protein QHH44_00685 [Candidatus Saccharicenans sp.]|jgi:hypothetical protein|nr:hypothetical protein [Candidatus Saccharicenans sp.]
MKMHRSQLSFLFFWLLFFISLGNIIAHDFLCHEELHQLTSPVHHSFHHPRWEAQDLPLPYPGGPEKIYAQTDELHPSDFVPSIFHPPD